MTAPQQPGAPNVLPALPIGAPVNLGVAGYQNALAQYGPQNAVPQPGQVAPGPIEENPYLENVNEKNAEQARFEAEHGRFATVATQAARGALDVVLGSGALLGAGLEGTGYATGWKGLEDFGRGLGESSTGTAALSTLFSGAAGPGLAALPGAIARGFDWGKPTELDTEAISAYERRQRDIHEQQEAWPMLSTVSHLAGATATAIGIGALASPATAAEGAAAEAAPAGWGATLTKAGITGGIEGSEAGAQGAYDEGRPLRDVLGSTIMGGLLAAGTGMAFQGAAHYLESSSLRRTLGEFAEDRTAKALLATGSDVRKMGGQDEVRRMARDIIETELSDGETVFPKSLMQAGVISNEDIAERVGMGRAEFGEKLGDMRRTVASFIDRDAPELRPSGKVLTDKIVSDIWGPLAEDPILSNRSKDVVDVVTAIENKTRKDGTIGLQDLMDIKDSLASKIHPAAKLGGLPTPPPESAENLQAIEGMLKDTMVSTIDKGAAKMGTAEGGAYKELLRKTQSFIQADQIMNAGISRRLGNRWSSLSDTLAGAAALGGNLATGGAIGAGAKALGVAALHKYLREHGSAIMASLATKLGGEGAEEALERAASVVDKTGELGIAGEAENFAIDAHDATEAEERGLVGGTIGGRLFSFMLPNGRDHQVVSVDAAGGREAQSVIAELARAKQQVNKSVEDAGPNPAQRQAAQQQAMIDFANKLAYKAGPFDPTTWETKAPNPLQKVLHRSDILNQVSTDLANGTSQAAALKPSTDFELNPDRVKKLTKDADGPTAIGNVQGAVRQMIAQAPATPTGDQMRYIARTVLQRLEQTDVAQTLHTGHELTRQVAALGAAAPDQVSQDFVARQISLLHQQLSDPSFGKAGAVYGKLTAPVPDGAVPLQDPAQIRETLKTLDSRGALPAALQQLSDTILAAHDAKKQLGGGSPDSGVAKQLKALDAKFTKGEDAVTLDGGPAGRVFDFFTADKPGAQAIGRNSSPDSIVINAIRPQMQKLLPMLGKESDRYTGAAEGKPPPKLIRMPSELQSLYRERMQTLAQNVTTPDPDSVAASLRGLPSVPPSIQTAVGAEAQQRMAQLLNDMPKPSHSLRGPAFQTLSSDDLRRANAMWEATVHPESVFADFHAGTVDYDKASYTWKQYPGLQQAAQAGLMDVLHAHLNDAQRAALPDSVLTQLDYLLGFGGTLQGTVDPGFSARMTALGQQGDQQSAQTKAPLNLGTSKPTFTERIAQGRG